MSQSTRPEAQPVIPILVFFVIVGALLFMLLPRSSQPAAETPTAETTDTIVPTEAPTQVAVAPTTEATMEATEISTEATVAPAEFDPAAAYAFACAGCHGVDGRGEEGFGPSLAFSSAVVSNDVPALVAMLTDAQPPSDPALGFVHPYRGGYPELTDDQLAELMDYLFTLIAG